MSKISVWLSALLLTTLASTSVLAESGDVLEELNKRNSIQLSLVGDDVELLNLNPAEDVLLSTKTKKVMNHSYLVLKKELDMVGGTDTLAIVNGSPQKSRWNTSASREDVGCTIFIPIYKKRNTDSKIILASNNERRIKITDITLIPENSYRDSYFQIQVDDPTIIFLTCDFGKYDNVGAKVSDLKKHLGSLINVSSDEAKAGFLQ